MPSWKNLVRPAIEKLAPFSSARSETAGGSDAIYLDANENPFDAGGRGYNRYPAPQPPELTALFAELYGAKPDHVFVSLGSEAGIDQIIRVFCESGRDAAMITPPTFALYAIFAAVQGAEILRVPLRSQDLQLDLPAIRAAWMPRCKLLFLATPNNPMGSLLRRDEILAVCAELGGRGMVVVDEAYQEFSDQPSLIPDIAQHDNLVILRTLSKAYGLAGVRCGAVIAHPTLPTYLRKVMTAYPIPRTTTDAVLAAMTPEKQAQRTKEAGILKSERERMAKALKGCPGIRKIFPSAGNFLALEVDDVPSFLARLKREGVVARDRRGDWPDLVRLTIGTPADNDRVLAILS